MQKTVTFSDISGQPVGEGKRVQVELKYVDDDGRLVKEKGIQVLDASTDDPVVANMIKKGKNVKFKGRE